MNESGKFQRSWRLFQTTLSVIRRQPKLLAFPAVSSFCVLFIIAFFLGGFALQSTGHPLDSAEHWKAVARSLGTSDAGARHHFEFNGVGAILMAAIYLVSMFLATFFNVAFYHEILAALRGEPVSLGRGFQFAVSRLKAILFWTLFAGVVGLIIKEISERLGWVGSLITRFLGLAWSVATVFAIPALVSETEVSNPLEILKRSAGTLRQTWGESLIGYVGMNFASLLVFLSTLGVVGGAVAAMVVLDAVALSIVVIALWVLFLIAYSYVMSVAGQVYKGALYLYATERVVVEPFSQEMLERAWKYKKS
jgi:hypothetical protein